MKVTKRISLRIALTLILSTHLVYAQDLPITQQLSSSQLKQLDPTRNITQPQLESAQHHPLAEEYIWTASDAARGAKVVYTFPKITDQTEPHYFRRSFQIAAVPSQATLYIAGPRRIKVWLNGRLAEEVESDVTSPLGMHVFTTSIAQYLKPGANTIAIQAIRGRGVTGFANSALVQQQTSGKILVAKIVPAAQNIDAPVLLLTDKQWKSSTAASIGWELPTFDDAAWKPVQSIGGIESSIDLFQWNADAGLYNWPGYDGISSYLAHTHISGSGILASYAGRGAFDNLSNLTGGGGEFTVTLLVPGAPFPPPNGPGNFGKDTASYEPLPTLARDPTQFQYMVPAAQPTHPGPTTPHDPGPIIQLTNAEAPSITLDFGRELTGRLEIVSDSDTPATLTVQMGESESENQKVPYLGVNQLTIAPHGTAHGPKTAFRYATIRFVGGGGPTLRFKAIRVDHIYYPVSYQGSFESSDELLNRIWETGAYTAHLCMQDGVWDASKRDRGRWMGDTDVSGRVIEDVFGEHPLMEDTLDRLLSPPGEHVDQHVNGIPGYSSFWFTGTADYYRHSGSKQFLEHEHTRMLELLALVDKEFDERNIYANKSNVWLYVDWSPELNGDTPETRRATTLEFYRAYHEAAWMLRELGDTANADKYDARAAAVKSAANKYLLDPKTGTFGPRWQTNAAAVIGGAASPQQYDAIWNNVLSQVDTGSTNGLIISPYYNYYVIRAMAELGHRPEALKWIRDYWGGMLAEGATSFWEAYDLSWYKEDFHSSLQSDNRSGYFVSLAHGWSSGPTAWLMEQILGIQPTGAGFSTVNIRPDLVDLTWARGAEPTPNGLLKVDLKKSAITIDLPAGTVAHVAVPVTSASARVTINGTAADSTPSENNTRATVTLDRSGHYELAAQ